MPDASLAPHGDGPGQPPSPEETVVLLERVRAGDEVALNTLLARMLPMLRRWAHGRLPRAARGMLDTGDIVQAVVSKALRRLAHLEIPHSGALGYYFRKAVANEIKSQWRRADRAPRETSLGDSLAADDTSPLEQLIGAERLQRYEDALVRLDTPERDAIIGRFEFAYSYDELARFLGKPSSEAARLAVHRAVKRLTEQARYV